MASSGAAGYKARRTGEMHILFVTATRIGDAVLSTGLLSHLIERYPGARLTIAAGPVAAPLFEAVPGLERLVVIEKRRWSLHWLPFYARGRDAPLGSRRRPARLGARLAVARRRAPGHGQGRCPRASGAPARRACSISIRRRARACGPRRITTGRPRRWFRPGAPVLAIGPAANWRGKQWRAERFAELAPRLTAAGGPLPGSPRRRARGSA